MILLFVVIALILCIIPLTLILILSFASVNKIDEYGERCDSFAVKVKKNKKKFLRYIIVLGSILILILGYKGIDLLIFECKSNFTVEDVEYATNRIFKQNMGFKSSITVQFWRKEREGSSRFTYPFKNVEPELLNTSSFYVDTDGGESWFVRHFEPTEIVASFECLLYFNGKTLPGGFIGVLNYQSSGGMDNSSSNTTFISTTEFKQLCTEVDIEGLSRRKAAEKLAERWIEKHNYVKR